MKSHALPPFGRFNGDAEEALRLSQIRVLSEGYAGRIWRVVEAQHRISTNRLATNSEDHHPPEVLAGKVKPQMPEGAQHLDFLLAAPFRYGHSQSSRFRRAG